MSPNADDIEPAEVAPQTAPATVRVVVGRIGRAHGLRGDVAVEVRTDSPEVRFAPGTHLITDDPTRTSLIVDSARWHGDRLLVQFEGIADRTGAEGLRGLLLSVDASGAERTTDPEEYFDWQLVGLRCISRSGADLGVVKEVIHLPGQDLLAVGADPSQADQEVLVPFVQRIAPHVDVARGEIVLDPPPGLFPDPGRGSAED